MADELTGNARAGHRYRNGGKIDDRLPPSAD